MRPKQIDKKEIENNYKTNLFFYIRIFFFKITNCINFSNSLPMSYQIKNTINKKIMKPNSQQNKISNDKTEKNNNMGENQNKK